MFKITVISCGNKMPIWIEQGVNEYSKRLKEYVKFHLIEIPLLKRTKACDLKRIQEKEAQAINAVIPEGARVVALEIEGEVFSSQQLATKFRLLQQMTSHICFIIGGPEGLTDYTRANCHAQWSLSALTLPHPLTRIILLEALYRTWTIIHNHPYHK